MHVSDKLGRYTIVNLFSGFLSNIGYFAIDKSNIPNIPIFMKIIDSWADDVGFLYGQSFLKPFMAILPSSLRPESFGYSLGMTIKETWYSNMRMGGQPPTGVGEMYMNFGWLGPFLGMFMFGAFCAWLYNLLNKTKSYWVLVAYSQILFGFVLFYPKGEFMNLQFFYFIPIALTVLLLRFLVYFSRGPKKTGQIEARE
jgi:hypothetical protein